MTATVSAMTGLPEAPGPRGHPIFGVVHGLRTDPIGTFTAVWREYGDTVRLPLGGPFVGCLVVHPDGVKHVLQDRHRDYGKVPWYNAQLRALLGEGLFTSQGETCLRQRRLMQPAFHRQRVEALGATMVDCALDLLDRWDRLPTGEVVDVAAEMMRLTLTVVGRTLLGADVADDVATVDEAVTVAMTYIERRIESYIALPTWVPTPTNRRFLEVRRRLDAIVYRIVEARRRDAANGEGDERSDLLSLLLAARDADTGAGMDDRQLRDEVMTIFLAGHETTAVALTWTWYLLSQHPEAARKLRDELAAVLGGRPPTVSDLPRLPYTRQVIDEALRLYPPAWALSRMPKVDEAIGGYRVPRRRYVYLVPYLTHRHPAFWPDPERFDPDRFAPERSEGRPRYAYFPFGGGPRQCIGNTFALMEAQLVLATLAQRYAPTLVPGHLVELEPTITLRARHGIRMHLRRAQPLAGRGERADVQPTTL